MTKTLPLCALIACLFHFSSYAQDDPGTRFSIGIKMYPAAVTARIINADNQALEGISYVSDKAIRMVLLYEMHLNITDNIHWYFGGGPHFSVWNHQWKDIHKYYGSDGSVGIDGIVGIEHTFEDSPLSVGLDWQPSYTIMGLYNGHNRFEVGYGGIDVRLTF